MKRIAVSLFAVVAVISLVGCGSVPCKPSSAPNYAPHTDSADRF